jgi:DNA-binding NtrC family response regulator
MAGENVLRLADVDEALGPRPSPGPIPEGIFRRHSYEEVLKSLDLMYFKHLFQEHHGDLEEIAKRFGTSTRSLYRRLEKHGLRPKDLLRELGLKEAKPEE